MRCEVCEDPIEIRLLDRCHPVLLDHLLQQLIPVRAGEALLGNDAPGMARGAVGVSLLGTVGVDEDAKIRRLIR